MVGLANGMKKVPGERMEDIEIRAGGRGRGAAVAGRAEDLEVEWECLCQKERT